MKGAFILLGAIVLVVCIVFGWVAICYSNSNDFWVYRGSEVVSLNQYQTLQKEIPDQTRITATAYDSATDEILVSYNFIGYKDDYITDGIPQGFRMTYWQYCNGDFRTGK